MKTSQQDRPASAGYGEIANFQCVTVDICDSLETKIAKDKGFYGITLPIMVRLPGTMANASANYTTPCFIANRGYRVVSVTARWETKAGATATLQVKKVPSGTAPASGTDLLTTAINLEGTANINYSGVLSTSNTVLQLVAGDSISLVPSGTLTAVVGLTVSILLRAI